MAPPSALVRPETAALRDVEPADVGWGSKALDRRAPMSLRHVR
jgi:hypothetical protein